jgi:hypothetical protein
MRRIEVLKHRVEELESRERQSKRPNTARRRAAPTVAVPTAPAEAWPVAFRAIAAATGCAEEGVRVAGISRTTWPTDCSKGAALPTLSMQRSIARRTSLETGILRGLPCLVGFVTDCEIMAEADA